ncbi:TIGR02611 family protein [Mycetocola miduiensis]|uniref:TIGR02611 family protein n=1 Tax=Mycetocola miduiensis TaxID=995034 RepID=A0A1I5B5J2_9MICO|nr:TIGR02611 family protein [Mycetocola miduiensis]SFN69953.1 TIGR02611 family protein [Mycetocola miduiensis]
MVTEAELNREIVAGENPHHPARRMLRAVRDWVDTRPRLRSIYRFGVGAFGGGIAVLGLLLVPLPGPGWLVVFLGLAVLGTEFTWAKKAAGFLKRMLSRFWAWWNARKTARASAAQ